MRALAARIRRVHFVGIGGAGMSGIAELLHARGVEVSGSDLRDGEACRHLRSRGIQVAIGHDPAHVSKADVVVRSSAIAGDNPEWAEARRLGLPVVRRAEMLAELMRGQDGIAIGGTHGKTTTTALATHLLASGGLDPSAVIGGRPLDAGSGARLGRGDWMVAEADESDGSFLLLPAALVVITNIEPEHLDHYGDAASLTRAFQDFAERVPFWGACIGCLDDPGVAALWSRLSCRKVSYGLDSGSDWHARELHLDPGGSRFRVELAGAELGPVRLPLPGLHNVRNALAALAVAREAGLDFGPCARALEGFRGVRRRFETRGEAAGVRVVDDYAHHPTELRATLEAARAQHAGPITAVFQPHRFSRTRDLMDDFARAFQRADRVVLCDVYAAGEAPIAGADAAALVAALKGAGHPAAVHAGSLDEALAWLTDAVREGEWVLTLGAGDVGSLGPRLLERLGSRGTGRSS